MGGRCVNTFFLASPAVQRRDGSGRLKMAFSGSPEARATAEAIALPSIGRQGGADDSRRPGSGATKRALLAERATKARPPQLRSKSVEPGMIDGARGDGPESPTGFSSFALYCEVKLKESRAVGATSGGPQLNVVRTCFDLLAKICGSESTMAAPLRSVTEELRRAIFSDQVDFAGGERKPYFQLVTELEADADRMRRNTAQIMSQAAMGQGNTGDGGSAPVDKDQRKKDLMTQSRLIHLETEMNHMFDSVQRADETILKMKAKEQQHNQLVKELRDQIATLKFELESALVTSNRAVRYLHASLLQLDIGYSPIHAMLPCNASGTCVPACVAV